MRSQDCTRLQDIRPVLTGHVRLTARLSLTDADRAVVVLASGGRSTEDDRYLAQVLRRAGFGTMVTDLLAEDEVSSPHDVFDVPLLAGRLRRAATWLHSRTGLPYAYVAADTAAAAARWRPWLRACSRSCHVAGAPTSPLRLRSPRCVCPP